MVLPWVWIAKLSLISLSRRTGRAKIFKMKKYHFINSTLISTISVSLLVGGCAVQTKKAKAPAPLVREIKSIEGQESSTHSFTSSKDNLSFRKEAEGKFSGEQTIYVMKKGDTLWRISKNYGVSVETILRSNHIANIKDLKVGQKLIIPVSGKSYTSFSSHTSYTPPLSATSVGVSSKGFVWPVKGQVVSQFGEMKDGIKNMGIDIQFQSDQKIIASKKGTIEAVSDAGDGTYVIVIKHDGGIRTMYGCRCDPVVGENNYVEQGQPIASINRAGANTPQEINFKGYVKDKPVNPISYLP